VWRQASGSGLIALRLDRRSDRVLRPINVLVVLLSYEK
jgi:hypothetical protein